MPGVPCKAQLLWCSHVSKMFTLAVYGVSPMLSPPVAMSQPPSKTCSSPSQCPVSCAPVTWQSSCYTHSGCCNEPQGALLNDCIQLTCFVHESHSQVQAVLGAAWQGVVQDC